IVQDGRTGYVVNPLNAELMAKKIIDLLKNPRKAKKLGQAGYERVKKDFNLDSHVAQTLSWYKLSLN
ncbi:MAG: glycosyltransferase, partial [bacterium]|nr:glycosyltransferase [bacterium]